MDNNCHVDTDKVKVNFRANTKDPEFRQLTREKFGWKDKTVFGFICRYMVQKNAYLVLIYYGESEKKMMEWVKVYGISNKVESEAKGLQKFYIDSLNEQYVGGNFVVIILLHASEEIGERRLAA